MTDSPQFAPTFREEVEANRRRLSKQHRILGFFARPVYGVILAAHRIYVFFHQRVKKFSGVAMVAAAFAVSSSFSFPMLSMRAGFVSLDADRTVAHAEAAATVEPVSDPVSGGVSLAGLSVSDARDGETAAESAVEFSGETVADPAELMDPSLLDEEYQYHSEGGNDLGETVTLSDLLGDGDLLAEQADDGGGEAGFSPDDWRLILVNKQHPIPEDYEVTLGTISGSMQCDRRIVRNLYDMFQGAARDGVNLIVCSPYRTHTHQIELFDRKIDRYMAAGLSYMDAYTRAAQAVTVPGTSEHEIGLAIDIVSDSYSSLNDGFGRTAAGKWLAAHSAEYGFILRYPAGKESITGIEYEPWHFRYVGREAAEYITDEGICLEEFWDEFLWL